MYVKPSSQESNDGSVIVARWTLMQSAKADCGREHHVLYSLASYTMSFRGRRLCLRSVPALAHSEASAWTPSEWARLLEVKHTYTCPERQIHNTPSHQ